MAAVEKSKTFSNFDLESMLMELHQLAYFVAVVDEGSFTRGAARMRVAQPGVSQQIRRLERELGETLLDRSGRQVRLTASGTAFLTHARNVLTAVAAGRQAIDEMRGLVTGRVCIGITANLPGINLPSLLAEFRKLHPGVQITLTEADAGTVLDHVDSGALDIGLVSLSGQPPTGISSQQFALLPLIIATALDDPLAHCAAGPLQLIQNRPLITLLKGSTLRELVDTGCARAGFLPTIGAETSNLRLLTELTAQGMGVAVLPAWAAEAEPAPLHTIAISGPKLQGRAFLIWTHGPTNPAARTFLALAQRHLPNRQRTTGQPPYSASPPGRPTAGRA
jgi:DNA-binding transcriptional LysR family regulator